MLAGCCRDTERLRFAYRARDGSETRREVEPHALVNLGRRWYLAAWDPARDDWRTFRVDRLERPATTGVRFEPRKLPAKDAATYVTDSIRATPHRYTARVTVRAPVEEARRRMPWGADELEPIDDATCELRTGDDDLHWLAMRVAMLGFEFEVHEPDELREELRRVGERLARA